MLKTGIHNFAELAGKQIKGVIEIDDHRVALVFTDGSYVGIEVGYGYSDEKGPLKFFDLDMDSEALFPAFVGYGLLTQEDISAFRTARDAASARQRHVYEQATLQRERAEYERLKAKFG